MPQYRALISIPLTADDDESARERAVTHAHSLKDDGVVIGHLELLGEVGGTEGLLKITRVVQDSGLKRQLPSDL
jgi:hypothetical protein